MMSMREKCIQSAKSAREAKIHRPLSECYPEIVDAVLNALMEVSPDEEAEIAEAIAAEFDLVLTELPNSEFMDFIAAAKAARLALIQAARSG